MGMIVAGLVRAVLRAGGEQPALTLHERFLTDDEYCVTHNQLARSHRSSCKEVSMRARTLAILVASSMFTFAAPSVTVATAHTKHVACGKHKAAHTNCGKHKGASKGKKKGHS
jgi:hypothetical protein